MKNAHYLGRLCPRGHEYGDTGQSLRRKNNYKCVECLAAAGKKYYAENKEGIAAYRKYQIGNVTDVYVRSQLIKRSPLTAADIPIELIALKREDIKLKRLIKERKDG